MLDEPQICSDNCNTSACVMMVVYHIEMWARTLPLGNLQDISIELHPSIFKYKFDILL